MALNQFDDQSEGINEINITPFVDVVLVLLVIFMVTAPMMVKDVIGLELPKAKTTEAKQEQLISVGITSSGQVILNGNLVTEDELKSFVTQALSADPQAEAVISADGNSKHFDFVRVIDLIKSAGLTQFSIQVEKFAETKQ